MASKGKTHCQGTAGFVVLGCGNAGYDRNGTTAGNTWQCFMEHADCFYTAYDKYMVQAIREAAFDYLLKPFEEQEFRDILARFVEQAEAGQRMSYPIGAPLHTGQTFIVFTPTNDMRALRPAEIGFFRYCSERKQWEVILNNQPPIGAASRNDC